VERITSRQNAVVGRYREAARGAAPDMLLDGIHLVSEALSAGIRLRHVMVAAAEIGAPDVARLLQRIDDVEIASASDTVMDAVSPVRSSSPIVALADRPSHDRSAIDGPTMLVVIACDVQDPGNVGAIVRVAESAGASGVVLAGQSADPYGWKALRGSMGSAFRLPIVSPSSIEDAVSHARTRHARVVATVPRGGTPLFESNLTGATALLVGGEGAGLPAGIVDRADARITIPMAAPVESLNAAVAAAVVLYEARRQRTTGREVGPGDSTLRTISASA
jgi:RNA methyltransferase, TrmH family